MHTRATTFRILTDVPCSVVMTCTFIHTGCPTQLFVSITYLKFVLWKLLNRTFIDHTNYIIIIIRTIDFIWRISKICISIRLFDDCFILFKLDIDDLLNISTYFYNQYLGKLNL